MIRLKGFDKYYFDPDTCRVFSKKSFGKFKLMSPRKDGSKDYFQLYHNGLKRKVYLWEILRDNLKGIEDFFNGSSNLIAS